MTEMRYHHSTKTHIMNHYYPSHRWIHPFLRGCLLSRHAQEIQAREEFALAAIEAERFLTKQGESGLNLGKKTQVVSVVASQARLRLEVIR